MLFCTLSLYAAIAVGQLSCLDLKNPGDPDNQACAGTYTVLTPPASFNEYIYTQDGGSCWAYKKDDRFYFWALGRISMTDMHTFADPSSADYGRAQWTQIEDGDNLEMIECAAAAEGVEVSCDVKPTPAMGFVAMEKWCDCYDQSTCGHVPDAGCEYCPAEKKCRPTGFASLTSVATVATVATEAEAAPAPLPGGSGMGSGYGDGSVSGSDGGSATEEEDPCLAYNIGKRNCKVGARKLDRNCRWKSEQCVTV